MFYMRQKPLSGQRDRLVGFCVQIIVWLTSKSECITEVALIPCVTSESIILSNACAAQIWSNTASTQTILPLLTCFIVVNC